MIFRDISVPEQFSIVGAGILRDVGPKDEREREHPDTDPGRTILRSPLPVGERATS